MSLPPEKALSPKMLSVQVGLILQAAKNLQVMMMLLGVLFVLYEVDYDTALVPNLKKLADLDKQVQEQQNQLKQQGKQGDQIQQYSQQLKTLKTDLILLSKDESPQVVAVAKSQQLVALIKEDAAKKATNATNDGPAASSAENPQGGSKPLPEAQNALPDISPDTSPNTSLLNLLKPGDNESVPKGPQRVFKSLLPTGLEATVDLMQPPTASLLAGGGAPAPSPTPAKEGMPTLSAKRYAYSLVLQGSYYGLVDYLNQLVQLPFLVEIIAVDFHPAEASAVTTNPVAPGQQQPEQTTYPLEMKLDFALYLLPAS